MNDILSQFTGLLDAKAAHVLTLLVVVGGILGRAYKAIRNGGGLVSIWRGLVFGTNTPVPLTDKPISAAQKETIAVDVTDKNKTQ